ncbi:unnamed protein product [Rotaria sp. Silwood1]|nr:unnamed protein product [Rotaria sp. Silwood1]CAF1194835.1 unnamed protein product [Rotaria sp. Silwood1]CAF4598091.1 unnamed protein product [Rotaria sp. Silwood1]
MNPSTSNNNNNTNTVFSPYLLSRFHQHLNHLNDMAFTHTKILQEIIEKRSNEPMTSSPRGSISSTSSSASSSTTIGSIQQQQQQQQRKRSYPCNDNHEIKNDNHLNKRPRKQSKPQQLLKIDNKNPNEQSTSSSDNENDDEEEIGEINESIEKQNTLPIPPPPILPFIPNNLPFLTCMQDLARTNNISSSITMGKFLENFQKELLSSTSMEPKRILPLPPPIFSQTVHHHHHPYFSQILFNNSFINHFPSPTPLARFGHSPSDHSTFPYHISTPKKRRTKVTDTRLSPRIASKIPSDDLTDDENSSSHHSSDENPTKSEQQSIEYNGFQITILTSLHLRKAKLMFFYTRYPSSSVLKVYFPDVRFNKLITAQLVKWFSNFREFFYQQIEKYARQCLAEGIRYVDDLIVTPNSDLYRILNLHYNRSNQINVPISFSNAVQAALREFFLAIQQQKDLESSWKKSIYKVMQRLDDQIPEFFKNDHWMHSM